MSPRLLSPLTVKDVKGAFTIDVVECIVTFYGFRCRHCGGTAEYEHGDAIDGGVDGLTARNRSG